MKKLNFLLSTAVAAALVLSTESCKKYDEGPALSLRTKKARVANEWKIEYAYDFKDGEDETVDYFGETWEFSKDGEWLERENGSIDKSGTWEFVSDKEALKIVRIGTGSSTDHYDILKLKEKEMWLKNDEDELHLVPTN